MLNSVRSSSCLLRESFGRSGPLSPNASICSEILRALRLLLAHDQTKRSTTCSLWRLSERRQSAPVRTDRKSTRLNSSHANISYAVFCLEKKKNKEPPP